MNSWTEFRRVWASLIVSLALVASACGSTSEITAVAEAAPTTTQSTTTAPSTTTEPPTTSTTTALNEDPILLRTVSPQVRLTEGVSYQTETEVPFQFELPETEGYWRAVGLNKWSITVVFGSENTTSGDDAEPGFNLAVAEEGATRESVVEAMIESRKGSIDYVRSDGLLEGRDAVILEGTYTDTSSDKPVAVKTGESSFFSVLFKGERTYRSQLFEDDGRVFVVSIDAHPDDVALVLAEIAPILESLEIGVES